MNASAIKDLHYERNLKIISKLLFELSYDYSFSMTKKIKNMEASICTAMQAKNER